MDFKRTDNNTKWSFAAADLECILLADFCPHGQEIYNKENCLEVLKFRNPQKYRDFSVLMLDDVVGDVIYNLQPYYIEWEDDFRKGEPRVEETKRNFRQTLSDILYTQLQVADDLQEIPLYALMMIVVARNEVGHQKAKDWGHIARGFNHFYPNYSGRHTAFSAANVEIIYRYLMVTEHFLYEHWAVCDCRDNLTIQARLSELDEAATK
ncbi:MAG: hypothetical protein LQ342_007693 [Letrouitia transgressa]|nr:MAG: hypothetical protein LQ342_007693 [Letrouitia transgressa]